MTRTAARILPPELVARLARFRLATRRRVLGRYAGGHASRRFGASIDFADHREYVAGDDPRRVDLAAYQRLGRLLIKLTEAEDEAAVRVVVDLSASMGFGAKAEVARAVTAALAALAANGQDRVRVLLAGTGAATVDAGPWFRGPTTVPAVEHRLLAVEPPAPSDDDPPGRATLVAALRRAHGEGGRGPVVLVSDLLDEDWSAALQALAAGRGDGLLVHVLGRDDLDPPARGDLRLIDAETGAEVDVGIGDDVLDRYAATRDAWLDAVRERCGRLGITYARILDDGDVTDLLLTTLRELGVVA